jgi:hypothetical protein
VTRADWYTRNGFYGAARQRVGVGRRGAARAVTLDTALNHSVVFTCKRIIAESVGMLPLPMMQRKGGEKIEAVKHPMFNALQNAPNDETTAQRFARRDRALCVGRLWLRADSSAQRDEGRERTGDAAAGAGDPGSREDRADSACVLVKDGNSAEKTYTVERGKPQDILHIPGIGGMAFAGTRFCAWRGSRSAPRLRRSGTSDASTPAAAGSRIT